MRTVKVRKDVPAPQGKTGDHTMVTVEVFTLEELSDDRIAELLQQPNHVLFDDTDRKRYILDLAQTWGPVIEITSCYIKFQDDHRVFLSTLTRSERKDFNVEYGRRDRIHQQA